MVPVTRSRVTPSNGTKLILAVRLINSLKSEVRGPTMVTWLPTSILMKPASGQCR